MRYGSRLARGSLEGGNEKGWEKGYWEFSSAGRASALQAEGQRFDPVNPIGPVV